MPDASASPPEARDAAAAGLVYTSDAQPGLRRVRHGSGFRYLDAQGRPVRDADTLARVRALAIPPAYTDVWICAQPRGHLQATGRDARGRKQYRYHARWRALRDHGKFERLHAFGQRLPALRRRLARDLARPGLPREKVLALVVSLLDATGLRVGNEEYARSNRSYGLTTLRNRHVEFTLGGRVRFSFRGKGGQPQELVVDDARLARLVRRCQQLPGQLLFQYLDDEGVLQPVDSGMVNQYLREALGEVAGEPFTAKDFRTWAATLQAFALLCATPVPVDGGRRAREACVAAAVRQVAAELGNTPAVCRNSYIHPGVLDAWRAGLLAATQGRRTARAALALLRRARNSRSRRGLNGSGATPRRART